MFQGLKISARRFRESQPGARFQELYHLHQLTRRSPWVRWLLIMLGVAIIAVGLIALPAPGPGTLVLAIGGALMARESLAVARALDWLEVRLRRVGRWARRLWHGTPLWAKVVIGLAGVALVALVGVGAWQILGRP